MQASTCCCPLISPVQDKSARTVSSRIELNVGGRVFATTRTTLVSGRGANSKLAALVSEPSPDGSFFLDRDGQLFQHVLNYLRDGVDAVMVLEDPSQMRQLLREAKALELSELASFIEGQIEKLQAIKNSPPVPVVVTGPPQTSYEPGLALPPIPSNEAERLEKLMSLNVLDTSTTDIHYDCITRIVAALLDAPICLVSLVAAERQWFKSRCGLEAPQTSRDVSFCAHALVPEDTEAHAMFVVKTRRRTRVFLQTLL